MHKTKLGISIGMLGALMYVLGLFDGYYVVVLIAGYVLLCEDNEWLRRTSVKVILTMLLFSALNTFTGFASSVVYFINDIFSMFGSFFYAPFISNLIDAIERIIGVARKILFLVLAAKALNQGTITIPVVDRLIDKFMR